MQNRTSPLALFTAPAAAALVAALAAQSSPARGHEIFHVFTPVIEQGHWGAELNTALQSGFARGADDPVRAAAEIGLHADVSPYWMTKVALDLEREAGDAWRATGVASENVFRFDRWSPRAVDFAWFAALSAGIGREATNAVEFGPILTLNAGPASLVLNPFFEKTFGRNREDGIAFTYAVRAAYTLREGFSVGIESYGDIENLGNAPPGREQVHRIGPVLYFGELHGQRSHVHAPSHAASHAPSHAHSHDHGHDHGSVGHVDAHAAHTPHAPAWHAEIGVFFGLTEATPDTALKLNGGFHF